MKYTFKILCALLNVCFFFSCISQTSKINGVSLVSPPSITSQKQLATVKQINANWVAIIPYAFMEGYSTNVIYDTNFQWWGERIKGVETLIKQAKNESLNIMLKPHLWISGDGWAGDFTLQTEEDWLLWEKSYSKYILSYAKIAQKNKVRIFCIGTELRQVIRQRPEFWKNLIKEIRLFYGGKLTYASNWDNYQNVLFWKDLDFIGIDSYFPLSEVKTPNIDNLKKSWRPIALELRNFSHYFNKPILFTEFGYTSSDYCAKETWSDNYSNIENQQSQNNAYKALFGTLWNQKWFAGGFVWKWHIANKTKRSQKTSFTPQNKLATKTIKKYFSKNLKF